MKHCIMFHEWEFILFRIVGLSTLSCSPDYIWHRCGHGIECRGCVGCGGGCAHDWLLKPKGTVVTKNISGSVEIRSYNLLATC